MKGRNEERDKWLETHPDCVGVVDGHFATDGFRVHWILGHDWPVTNTWVNAKALAEAISEAQTSAVVSTQHLVRAIKSARVMSHEIVLSFGDELQIGTTSAELGDVLVPLANGDEWPGYSPRGGYCPTFVTYRKTGPDALVKMNSTLLMDAVVGMDTRTTVAIKEHSGGRVLYLSSQNENRALVMSLLDATGPSLPGSKKEVKL